MKIPYSKLNVLLMPTDGCNMDCIYCFNEHHHDINKKMSINTLERFYQITLPNVKEINLIWHGGEPLTMGIDFFYKAMDLQKKYTEVNIKNSIQSNLTLANEAWIKFFQDNNFAVGSSFDGTQNDFTRHNSSTILAKSKLLREHGLKNGFISVISQKNIDFLIDDYNFFKRLGSNYTTNFFIPTGSPKDQELKLDPNHALTRMCDLFDYWMKDTDNPIHIKYFESFLNYFIYHKRNICTMSSCLGRWVGIKYDGEIVPCNRSFPEEFSYGNVYDYDNIENAFDSEGFRNLLLQSIDRRESCKEKQCPSFDMCVGGCNNVALQRGTVSSNNEEHCTIFRGIYNHIRRRLDKLDPNENINPIIKEFLNGVK